MTIDDIHDIVDEKMKSGQVKELDELLRWVSLRDATDILMSWVTASIPMRGSLKNRRRILSEIESREGRDAIRGLE